MQIPGEMGTGWQARNITREMNPIHDDVSVATHLLEAGRVVHTAEAGGKLVDQRDELV